MPVMRGILGPHTFDDVPWHTHDYSEISGQLVVTEADITTLSASKITTGTIDANTITLGAGGVIKSSDFVTGDGGTGFQISGGLAEFNNVTVRGLLIADTPGSDMPAEYISAGTLDSGVINTGVLNADNITSGTLSADFISGGTISGDLISGGTINGTTINAGTITTGTLNADNVTITNIGGSSIKDDAIDADHINVTSLSAISGTMGTLTVNSTLTMNGTGVIKTAATGNPRIEIGGAFNNELRFYGGASGTDLGSIIVGTAGPWMKFTSPDGGYDEAFITLSGGFTGTSFVEYSADAHIWTDEGSVTTLMSLNSSGVLSGVNEVVADVGASNDPSYTFDGNLTTGVFYNSGVALTVAGNQRFVANASGATVTGVLNVTNEIQVAGAGITDPSYTFSDSGQSGMTWANNYIYIVEAESTVLSGNGSDEVYLGGMASGSGTGPVEYIGTRIYYDTSSRRFKKNIRYAKDLNPDLLLEWRPRRFKFKESPETGDHLWYIAEEIFDTSGEEYVKRDEDGEIANTDQKAMMVLLVEKVKAQHAEITDLTERLAKVESLLAAA